ncbi:ABC transporter permease [Prescottella subtropica]|uniref:ABC transporter permease n=1 Tax=Prescottella subtropica TaxID=2545757 RepID=UPI003BABF5F4
MSQASTQVSSGRSVDVIDIDFPDPNDRASESEHSAQALVVHSRMQSWRLLKRWSRDPTTVVQALLYPALMLFMFSIVLGDSIEKATGAPAVYGYVPMMILTGSMFGSVVSAVGLRMEKESGLLGRFWTLPIHRASGLVGRMIAESVRVLATTIVILIAGFALGFRFDQGPLAALALLLVPLLFSVAFAMMVTAFATYAGKAPLVEFVSLACTLLMFFNTGFVPLMAYPKWLQPVVEHQPMSYAIDVMRGLSLGGPVLTPLIGTLVWSVGIFAVFLYPAIRGYKHAAQTGA